MELNFKTLIDRIFPLTDEELQALRNLFESKTVHKKDFLLKLGEPTKDLFFLNSGIFRGYCLKDVEEITTNFLFGPTFYADVIAIKENSPATFNIQALEGSTILYADIRKVEELGGVYPNILRLFLRFYENIFSYSQKRQLSFIYDSAESRYIKLIKDRPKVASEIPLVHIASYLGIKPESLSRIRKKIANQRF